GLAKAGKDVLTAKSRPLTNPEIAEAKTVFSDTINCKKIVIADALGYNNRAFTFIGAADIYTLFMGPSVFAAMRAADWHTFIHEMTHVWQGQNHFISSGYMLNSVVSQAIEGNTAYDYTPGQMWGEYNVEQQAHLVEDWYNDDGKSVASRRYYYIENCIRKPWRAWFSDMFVDLTAGAAAVKG
ncbi:MAG: hypothetical protein M3Y22_13900, partial [Pseudomonadota bacterium]|nr:hypothetical protein [Pseudomonadota bacterium]